MINYDSVLSVAVCTHLIYRMYCCGNLSVQLLMGFFGLSQICSDTQYIIPCSYLASITYLRIDPWNSGLGRYFLTISIPLNMLAVSIRYQHGFINPMFAVIVGNTGVSPYQTVLQICALGSSIISNSLCCILLVELFAEYDRSLTWLSFTWTTCLCRSTIGTFIEFVRWVVLDYSIEYYDSDS